MPQNDRIGIDKFRAAFDAVKTDERAASDEGYDAVIASVIDIEFIRDIIEDEAIHHAALTLPLDKRLHKLSTSNRKLLEEKRHRYQTHSQRAPLSSNGGHAAELAFPRLRRAAMLHHRKFYSQRRLSRNAMRCEVEARKA